jgi:hypothetical protein
MAWCSVTAQGQLYFCTFNFNVVVVGTLEAEAAQAQFLALPDIVKKIVYKQLKIQKLRRA